MTKGWLWAGAWPASPAPPSAGAGHTPRNSNPVPGQAIATYEEYLGLFGLDVDTPMEREAWEDGRPVSVRLPLIAARPRSLDQYRAEVTEERRPAGIRGRRPSARPA